MRNIILFILFISTNTWAAELAPIIVSSKQDLTKTELTSRVEILEGPEIDRFGGARLSEQLQNSSSLDVVKTGISGGQASVFIRGAEARHTVFVIDGVRIYDAASIQKILNPAIINSAQIEKIEILKGAQSVLYGSDAIGGVVNIITKKNSLKNSVSIESGIYNNVNFSNSFLKENTFFSIDGHYEEDNSHNDLSIGSEIDKKKNQGLSLGMTTSKSKWDLETQIKILSDFSETDGQDFSTDLPVDAKDNFVESSEVFVTQKLKYTQFSLDLNYQSSKRLNQSGNLEFNFNGEVFQSELKWVGDRLLLGASFLEETYSDDDIEGVKLNNFDLFTNYSYSIGSYNFELGLRGTSNKYYGEHLVYNTGVSKKITKNQSMHLSQKTGYKAPSSYQLFGKTPFGEVGNENLTPEKSTTIELGHTYTFNKFSSEITLFQNSVENYIDFENNKYRNISESFNQGIELGVGFQEDKYFANLSSTLIDFNLSTGEKVERRASENLKASFGKNLNDSETMNLLYRYSGTRYEDINGRSQILSAYDVVDLSYFKTVSSMKYSLMLKNIFDKKFEEAYLYATQRFGVQVGATYTY